MKAVIFNNYGSSSVLQVENRDKPQIDADEVLIKVVSAGLNRADIAQRKGNYPAPKGSVQDILGLEVAGVIEKTGKNVQTQKVGHQVCALLPGGGYAEYVKVHTDSCLPIPANISLENAGALPETLLTVWQNIFQIGQLKPHQNVLIYGGSGGVGSMAIQLVTLFGGRAFTLARTPEKIKYCQDLGAQKVVNYKTQNVVNELGENSMDLILDSVGGPYLNYNLDLLKPEGQMVYINAMEGKEKLNIFKMMQKRIHITGSTLRARSHNHKAQLIKDVIKNGFPLLERNSFKNRIAKKFDFTEAKKAHDLMESRDFMGKILLLF